MSKPKGVSGLAFDEAVQRFRYEIGASRTLPRASRTLPRLKTPKHRHGRKLVIALCILILVAAGTFVAPQLSGSDPVPPQLVGNWATSNPGYEGRNLVLTRDSLLLRASAHEATGYRVRRVQSRQTTAGTAYLITGYSEPGGEYTLTLAYSDENQTIALGKPAHVLWHRVR